MSFTRDFGTIEHDIDHCQHESCPTCEPFYTAFHVWVWCDDNSGAEAIGSPYHFETIQEAEEFHDIIDHGEGRYSTTVEHVVGDDIHFAGDKPCCAVTSGRVQ